MSPPEVRKVEDPLVDEVREIRRSISQQVDNDVDRLCEYLREIEKTQKDALDNG